MVDISLLSTFRRVLYQVDYDKLQNESKMRISVASLVDLSSKKIVMDSSLTHVAAYTVPVSLLQNLMKAALLEMRDRAIEILVAHWPWKFLKLSEFVPPLFSEISTLHDSDYVKDCMRRGIKYTTSLAHIFVENLKKKEDMKLRFLDLSGYPMGKLNNYLAITLFIMC